MDILRPRRRARVSERASRPVCGVGERHWLELCSPGGARQERNPRRDEVSPDGHLEDRPVFPRGPSGQRAFPAELFLQDRREHDRLQGQLPSGQLAVDEGRRLHSSFGDKSGRRRKRHARRRAEERSVGAGRVRHRPQPLSVRDQLERRRARLLHGTLLLHHDGRLRRDGRRIPPRARPPAVREGRERDVL